MKSEQETKFLGFVKEIKTLDSGYVQVSFLVDRREEKEAFYAILDSYKTGNPKVWVLEK